MRVYLDYAATTPVKKEVFKAMKPYFGASFGNPSSIHYFGQEAKKATEDARKIIADFLNCSSPEIIYTGSGSEADNLAIKGLAGQFKKPHIITSAIEHHAVIKTCQDLEQTKKADVSYLRPNKDGVVSVEQVRKAIKQNTVLVSIMYVNNETGVIQPIREIGKMIESINKLRSTKYEEKKKNQTLRNSYLNTSKIYFHTDAVQATEYLKMDVNYLHVDMLTIAGHKIGAPKGIGVLYAKQGTPIKSIIWGGSQEQSLRAGTENVPYIVGIAQAIRLINPKSESRNSKIRELKHYFIQKIQKEIPDVLLNGSSEDTAPHIVNLYFKNIEGESIVLALDLEGVACSTGSACTSQDLEPSHVIMAMFGDHFRAAGSVRFSFSNSTTQKEIDYCIEKLKKVIERLRKISPYN